MCPARFLRGCQKLNFKKSILLYMLTKVKPFPNININMANNGWKIYRRRNVGKSILVETSTMICGEHKYT
jgi:hypothetical protein